MRKAILGFTIAFVIGMLSASAYAQRATKAPEAKASKEPRFIILEEEDWMVLVDEPAHHFSLAHENFLKKEMRASANEIRTGAALLKLEATRATGEGEKALMYSAQELDKLADEVEKGTVTSAKELDSAFARAHLALAKHHHLKASEAMEKKEYRNAGDHLKAAATHLERGMTWAGYEEEDMVVKAANDTRLVAGKIIEGTGWVSEEVSKALDDTGKAIDKLGKAIEPAKK